MKGRDKIVILPRKEPELLEKDGQHWLPKERVLKVFRIVADDKSKDVAIAKRLHDLAVSLSIDEAALAQVGALA